MNTKLKNVINLFLPIILGSIVGFIIKDYIDYSSLIKPPLAPPKIVFPIAWSIIYLLMGISYYLLNKNNEAGTLDKTVYYGQLIINLLWSIIFFLFKLRLLSCLWIILLDFLVLSMNILFSKKEKIYAYLNIPYFIWILFATYLTIGIYIVN